MVILLYLTRAQSSLTICTRSKGKVVSLFNHPSILRKTERTQQITEQKKKETRARNVREKRLVSQKSS